MMLKTIRLFSDEGKNVIADCLLLEIQKNDLLRECVCLFRDYPLLFVRVDCGSLSELARREEVRGDRDIGQGESQLKFLAPQDTYDLTVDTYAKTTEECANEIIRALEITERSGALDELHKNFMD